MRKRFISPSFDKENYEMLNTNEAKEEIMHCRREDLSQFATPVKEEANKISILDKMLYKNHFDSYDSRSPINISVFEEKEYHGIVPIRKILGSNHKIQSEDCESEIGGDVKFGENELSPFQEKFKNIWRSCIDNGDRKHYDGQNDHPKGFGKVLTKRTP